MWFLAKSKHLPSSVVQHHVIAMMTVILERKGRLPTEIRPKLKHVIPYWLEIANMQKFLLRTNLLLYSGSRCCGRFQITNNTHRHFRSLLLLKDEMYSASTAAAVFVSSDPWSTQTLPRSEPLTFLVMVLTATQTRKAEEIGSELLEISLSGLLSSQNAVIVAMRSLLARHRVPAANLVKENCSFPTKNYPACSDDDFEVDNIRPPYSICPWVISTRISALWTNSLHRRTHTLE